MDRIKKVFQSTASVNGSYSVGMIALAIVAVILVNLIAGKLPDNIKTVDVSDQKVYDISDESKKILKKLDQNITFTVYAQKKSTDERIKTFIKKYAKLSDKISVKWVDPALHPGELTENNATENTIVIASKETGREKTVSFSDIIVSEYTSYYSDDTRETAFDGEGQFTSAIQYVTSDISKKLYVTTGHGESEFGESLTNLLTKNNMEVASVNLIMNNEIPEDCELLIMNGVEEDLAEAEEKLLDSYMGQGGKIMIILGNSSDPTPNLEKLLKKYSMSIVEGYIADLERCYQGQYYNIFPEITDSTLASGMTTGMVLMANAKGLKVGEPSDDAITVNSFMTTSENGYAIDGEKETQGTYALGAYAEKTVSSDTDESSDTKTGRLTVITSSTMIDSQITDAFSTLENLTLFVNAITANFDDVENTAIPSKSLSITYNTMQHAGLLGFLVIFVLPFLLIVIGFRKWWIRRRA